MFKIQARLEFYATCEVKLDGICFLIQISFKTYNNTFWKLRKHIQSICNLCLYCFITRRNSRSSNEEPKKGYILLGNHHCNEFIVFSLSNTLQKCCTKLFTLRSQCFVIERPCSELVSIFQLLYYNRGIHTAIINHK